MAETVGVRQLFLIGPRGSGKTTVGRLVATLLQREHADLDRWIAEQVGLSIGAIFQQLGEPAFREWEARGLAELTNDGSPPRVISLGGGACQAAENRQRLRQRGRCVWLWAEPARLHDRLRQDREAPPDQRPALTELDELAELEWLIRARRPGYEQCADYAIDTGKLTPPEVARQIVDWWQSVDK